jgi:uncharacterized protein YbbC (DUF1343 family)
VTLPKIFFSCCILTIICFSIFGLTALVYEKPENREEGRIIVGADRLFSEFSHLLDGKNIGLISNHSGRLSDGTHLADTLFEYPNAELIALFGMEFNIRSNDYSLPRDEQKTTDPGTGVPKYSLYGSTHKPTNEMLAGVDVVIFDIQEVGARFYEHVNILGFVMEAAAENNIEVLVLDRPNPITGQHMDGFITDDEFLYSFGAYGKIPVLHGMTIGELARLYNGEKMLRNGLQANLRVIEMKGWERSMWYDETGLNWKKPSPNLPTLQSILAYVGICLFEGLNISEGRGTDKPFEFIGAPWIDHHAVAGLLNNLALQGVVFEPIQFTPERKSFHSRAPYLTGERCNGIFVRVTDRNLFEPYKAGIAIVWAIHKLHADKMVWDREVMTRLTGTRQLVNMIKKGSKPNEIFTSWKAELEGFKKISEQYIVY